MVEEQLGPDEWLVDTIDGHRIGKDGRPEFLVRWKNFGENERTWEPMGHLVTEALGAYFTKEKLSLGLVGAKGDKGKG